MDLGLHGRVAVVTAASKGLGRATALALAAEGAKIVLNARDATALDKVAEQIPDALVVPGDITAPDLPALLVQSAVERWGRVDAVVAKQLVSHLGRTLDVTADGPDAVSVEPVLGSHLLRCATRQDRTVDWTRTTGQAAPA